MSACETIAAWARKLGAKTAVLVGPGREGELALALERAGVEVTKHVRGGVVEAQGIPACDALVLHHAVVQGSAWSEALKVSAKHASKLVVVVSANPKRFLARARGDASREVCATEDLAPVLWDVGRVREHLYLGAPERVPARFMARFATEHVFVVDVTPRTPQAKRRLQTTA